MVGLTDSDVLRCNEASQDVLNEVLSDVLDVLNLARIMM